MIDINDIMENHYSKSGFNQHPNDPRIGKHTKYTKHAHKHTHTKHTQHNNNNN